MQINTSISGSATIGTGATLELAGADTGSVTFSSSKGTLVLDHSSTFSGQIFNFTGNGSLSGSDQIDLRDINYNSVQYSYSNGVFTITDGTDTSALNFKGSYRLANFKLASDGSGGTIVYDPPLPNSGAASGTKFADNDISLATGPHSGYGSANPGGFWQRSRGVVTRRRLLKTLPPYGGPSVSWTRRTGGMHNTHGYGGSTVIDPPLVGAVSQINLSGKSLVGF